MLGVGLKGVVTGSPLVSEPDLVFLLGRLELRRETNNFLVTGFGALEDFLVIYEAIS